MYAQSDDEKRPLQCILMTFRSEVFFWLSILLIYVHFLFAKKIIGIRFIYVKVVQAWHSPSQFPSFLE